MSSRKGSADGHCLIGGGVWWWPAYLLRNSMLGSILSRYRSDILLRMKILYIIIIFRGARPPASVMYSTDFIGHLNVGTSQVSNAKLRDALSQA